MSNNRLIDYITPDETMTWDTKQIAEEIPGFEFLGPGWYTKSGSWMVLIPTMVKDLYTIQVWYNRDPRGGFAAFVEAPLRATDAVQPKTTTSNAMGLLVVLVGSLLMIPLSVFIVRKLGIYWDLAIMVALWVVIDRIVRAVSNRRKT
jgi:hypothetical protein